MWVFVGMMAACGAPQTVNSSLTLKSNINVMGRRVTPRETAVRELVS